MRALLICSSTAVVCALGVASIGLAASVTAAPPDDPVRDGVASPQACAAAGFRVLANAGEPAKTRTLTGQPNGTAQGSVTIPVPPPAASKVVPPTSLAPATPGTSASLAPGASTGNGVASAAAPPAAALAKPSAPPGAFGSLPPRLYAPPAPAASDTEKYPNASVNPVKRVADAPVSTFSTDVD